MEVDYADSSFDAQNSCLDDLQRNLEILNSFTVDMEAGKKKRKREIEAWLEEVEKTRAEVVELQRDSQGGFERSAGINIRDSVSRLNATVEGLIQQWKHLREMFLETDQRNGEAASNTENSVNVSPQELQRIWACLSIDF